MVAQIHIMTSSSGNDAKVYIDGVYKANTPYYQNQPALSYHEIRIEKSGYQTRIMGNIRWPPNGMTYEMDLDLNPTSIEYQDYSASGIPSGVGIWEGNNLIGYTPLSFRLSYETHVLTFKKSGYQDQTTIVGTRPGGDTIYVTYALVPIPSIGRSEILDWYLT